MAKRPVNPTIKMSGVEALAENFNKLRKKARDGVRKATMVTLMLIQNDAKRFCPVDTNRLRASISSNWTDSGMARGRVQGKVEARPGKKPSTPADGIGNPDALGLKGITGVVGTNVEYAEAVENLTPFLWGAFQTNKAGHKQRLVTALGREFETLRV